MKFYYTIPDKMAFAAFSQISRYRWDWKFDVWQHVDKIVHTEPEQGQVTDIKSHGGPISGQPKQNSLSSNFTTGSRESPTGTLRQLL